MAGAKLTGNEALVANIKRLGKAYPEAMAGALYKLGVVILSEALPRVPVEFAVLRTSGYVSPPEGEGVKANVEVGFGTVYAVAQHERMDYRHPRGGEAKYLEKAVHAVAPRSLEMLSKWLEATATSGGGKWGAAPGVSSRPVVRGSNGNRKSGQQAARLKRGAANVRKRTGR